MKSLRTILSLLAAVLLSSVMLAQTVNLPEGPTPQDSQTKVMVSQGGPFPRFPRGPMMPPRGRPYPSAFAPHPPALSPLGALIGFGAGAALGAAASGDQTARGRIAGGLIGGGICALIGGAIGSVFSLMPSHNFRNRSVDDLDEQAGHRRRRRVTPTMRAPDNEPDLEAASAPNPVHSSE